MKSDDIVSGKLFTLNQVVRIIISVAMAVFTITMIWNRFLLMEQEIKTLEDRIEKKDKRASDDRKSIWKEVNKK